MSHIPIQSTIALDHCWICRSTDGLHEHHVVPQSCGGTHGPTVTLCAAHHNVIHTEAHQPDHKRRFKGTAIEQQKLAYLTEVIYRSFLAIQGQERPLKKSFVLSVKHVQMWNAIRSTMPGISSDQKQIEAMIEKLYQQTVTPLR